MKVKTYFCRLSGHRQGCGSFGEVGLPSKDRRKRRLGRREVREKSWECRFKNRVWSPPHGAGAPSREQNRKNQNPEVDTEELMNPEA